LVTILPFQENIPVVMASLDLFMMPSYGETFGRVLIEAMASGVPVLATKAGGVVSLIRNGQDGILVEPQSAAALAQALENCLMGTYDLASLGKEALKTVAARFDLQKVQQELFG